MIIGSKELELFPFALDLTKVPEIPFSVETQSLHAGTHVLVFTPKMFADGTPITLNALREKFGVDSNTSEPCFYNQDWYLKEEFASSLSLDGQWHLIQKEVLEGARTKRPEDIQSILSHSEQFPSAVTCAFAFFSHWFLTNGEALWKHDFVWCSDLDHNGDRIYVGRYEDPAGVNNKGFNIHRHLALRPAYSAAPEIIAP